MCLTDFLPLFAELAGVEVPEGEAEDEGAGALLGGEPLAQPLRTETVHHSSSGEFAIRQGDWVLIDALDGSDRDNELGWLKAQRGYQYHDQPGDLFNLAADPAQTNNLYAQHPRRVVAMRAALEAVKDR